MWHHMISMLTIEVRLIPTHSAEARERLRQLQALLLTGALRHARPPIQEILQAEEFKPTLALDHAGCAYCRRS